MHEFQFKIGSSSESDISTTNLTWPGVEIQPLGRRTQPKTAFGQMFCLKRRKFISCKRRICHRTIYRKATPKSNPFCHSIWNCDGELISDPSLYAV